jgi:ribosomal protein S18 acetylase RimI-like enzyme
MAGTEHAEIARDSEAEFRYFGVRTDQWGSGIGRALVETAEQIARDIGATDIVMSVIAHNAAALAMYQRYGYERVPERDWYPAPDIALLVLSKNIIVG